MDNKNLEDKTKELNKLNNLSNLSNVDALEAENKKTNFFKKYYKLLIAGGVMGLTLIFVIVGLLCGWFRDWVTGTGEQDTYYSVGGKLVKEGGSITVEVAKPVYKEDTIIEGLTAHDYGDYLEMDCFRNDTMSYSGFVSGDEVECRMGFSRETQNADINYMIGLMFDVETTGALELESVTIFENIEANQQRYDVGIDGNRVTIKSKDEYVYSGINFRKMKFITIRLRAMDGFDGSEIIIKNIHLDTGGKNVVYGSGGAIAYYDPDSIDEIKKEVSLSTDALAYGITMGDNTRKLVFYERRDNKFVETKSVDYGECALSKMKDYEYAFIVQKACRVEGGFSDWNTVYHLYNYRGDLLAELDKVYFSVSEDLDRFVGRLKESGEWKLFSIDGSVIRSVNPDDFVFKETGIAGGKILENISEL